MAIHEVKLTGNKRLKPMQSWLRGNYFVLEVEEERREEDHQFFDLGPAYRVWRKATKEEFFWVNMEELLSGMISLRRNPT